MDVVVVESPAKAKTINKYLGSNYTVLASYGHVRDLPAKDGSVRPDEDFAMSWEVPRDSSKRLTDIAKAVKGADRLILATDPDREGEAISWHVLEVLKNKKVLKDVDISRVVFNAITKDAVTKAMASPREIDTPLVDAYLARRALDYLVGFNLSPVLWRKLPGARSAGRVQSVALRLVCEREAEIERFKPQEYWSLAALLATKDAAEFEARLVGADGKKITRLDIGTEAEAKDLKAALEAAAFTVAGVEAKPVKRNPQPPFTTSTLQQEASRKLGFAPSRTMQVAQKLYEEGLITYMRTDGVQIAPEAIQAARSQIGKDYGDRYVPSSPRNYSTKAKNAQEAHEGIRPTDMGKRPRDLNRANDTENAKLYDLIWKRTIASQMASAELERTTVDIDAVAGARRLALRATGQVVRFDGFLTLYQEGRDDDGEDEGSRLPAVSAGDTLSKREIKADQHFTEPPPRFSEASLIKRMEELGIGRPSTYAATMATLRDRDYVRLDKRRLVPQAKGRLVTGFLESFFTQYVGYDFTADLEKQLDLVSDGKLSWQQMLRAFWEKFTATIDGTKELRVSEVLDALNEILAPYAFPVAEEGVDPRACPSCDDGKLSLKVSRYGAFIGCSNYPDCKYTKQLDIEEGAEANAATPDGTVLGQHPETGEDVIVKAGRFGPYVQLGQEAKEGETLRRTSIPKGKDPRALDLAYAVKLLSLPREIGPHPEDGVMITAGLGRYGPFVKHDKTYANLDSIEDAFEVGITRAVDLIAQKKAGGGRRGGASSGRNLGEHPTAG
ncbi:MAG: type I DNA topoisomerase, partial [Pseudomonadota bacterium]